MILRNYYNLQAMISLKVFTNDGTWGDNYLSMKDENGSLSSIYDSSSYQYLSHASLFDARPILGSGNTPPTFDDYKLEAPLDLTLDSYSFQTKYYDADTKKWTRIKTATFTNNTGADVTVSEMGIYRELYTASYNTSNFYFYREVLDEPFTISAGATVAYSYKIDYQMPTV